MIDAIPRRTADSPTVQPLLRTPSSDAALEQLLHEVYVTAGYTAPADASTLFAAASVHARGLVLGAVVGTQLVGTVTLVDGSSTHARIASPTEAELHLLAVRAERRGSGIGEALVGAVLQAATVRGARTLWLWTQPTMVAAQRLYERAGFKRDPARDFQREHRRFLVYARTLGA